MFEWMKWRLCEAREKKDVNKKSKKVQDVKIATKSAELRCQSIVGSSMLSLIVDHSTFIPYHSSMETFSPKLYSVMSRQPPFAEGVPDVKNRNTHKWLFQDPLGGLSCYGNFLMISLFVCCMIDDDKRFGDLVAFGNSTFEEYVRTLAAGEDTENRFNTNKLDQPEKTNFMTRFDYDWMALEKCFKLDSMQDSIDYPTLVSYLCLGAASTVAAQKEPSDTSKQLWDKIEKADWDRDTFSKFCNNRIFGEKPEQADPEVRVCFKRMCFKCVSKFQISLWKLLWKFSSKQRKFAQPSLCLNSPSFNNCPQRCPPLLPSLKKAFPRSF